MPYNDDYATINNLQSQKELLPGNGRSSMPRRNSYNTVLGFSNTVPTPIGGIREINNNIRTLTTVTIKPYQNTLNTKDIS